MSFLNPAFLYGLIALAIPIIIHLFHFRKAKTIYFSNTSFLQSVKKVSQSKLQLKHYLILAARLLFIAFLVLTFAQPYIPSATGGEQAQLVDIYLDNSYSMSNQLEEEEDLTGLDAAIQLANEVVNAYPTGTRFRLLTNNFETASQYYTTRNIVSDRLTEVTYQSTSRSLDDILERLEILPSELRHQKRDVFILSDFQESSIPESDLLQAEDSLAEIYFLPVSFALRQNVYVDSVYLEEPLIFTSNQNTIYAVLRNAGQESVDEMPVTLSVNGVQVSNALVSIPAKGQETISFQLNFPLQPYNKGIIAFDDYPVIFDNEFNFVIRKAAKVRVIELKDQEGISPIGRVFADSSYFSFNSYQASNVDYGALKEAELVVVNGLSTLNENLQAALLSYQQEGGTLLLIPGEQGLPEAATYLTEALTSNPVSIQNPIRLAPIENENPFFQDIFEDAQGTFDMPRARPVSQWSGKREDILELQTGNPFLSKSGETYVLATPLEEEYTNFHQHALFVPVMYKIAFNSLEVNNSLYQTTNQNLIQVQADQLEADNVYRLRKEGQEFIPNQRLNGRDLQLELPSYTLEPGFYELTTEEEGTDPLYLLAFNHPPQESQLDQLNPEELKAVVENNPGIQLLDELETGTARAGLGDNFEGTALWKWALLLALLSLLAEVLLIRFWK